MALNSAGSPGGTTGAAKQFPLLMAELPTEVAQQLRSFRKCREVSSILDDKLGELAVAMI